MLKGLGQPNRNATNIMLRVNVHAQRPFSCGVCSGNHPLGSCPSHQPRTTNLSNQKWCDFCKKWTNHVTIECYHRVIQMWEQVYVSLMQPRAQVLNTEIAIVTNKREQDKC